MRSRLIASMKALVGVCQPCVGADKAANFDQCKRLVTECKRRGAEMVFLPEASDYLAESSADSLALAEPAPAVGESGADGTICGEYCRLARELGVAISLGVHGAGDAGDSRMRNTHLIVDARGVVRAAYDKCHLFDVDIPGKVTLRETEHTRPGDRYADPVATPVGVVAAMICYDLRFPDISSEMRRRGAQILTYPSAFTVPTGRAHWEVLLRARAVENQCYVVAAAQTGVHNPRRASYGHSMVVDPWGVVTACAGDGVGVIVAEIDLARVDDVRASMPVLRHRRTDLMTTC